MHDVACLQPCTLPFGLDGRVWEWCCLLFMEIRGGKSGGREWWSGAAIADGGCGGMLAVAVTIFTHVVTATPRSVLTN